MASNIAPSQAKAGTRISRRAARSSTHARIASAEDRGSVVGEMALSGTSARCVAALELFVDVYGQEAGNLAVRCVAAGGVVLGGGIAPKILPALIAGDRFRRAFTAKGRFGDFLAGLVVDVVLDSRAPLLGAAHLARAGR
jgi:glucokinase